MTKRGSLMVSTSRYQATGSELDWWLGKVYSTINLLWVKNEYQICFGTKQTPRWVDYQYCTYHKKSDRSLQKLISLEKFAKKFA